MHIPMCETSNQEILTFADAQGQHSDSAEYDKEKWIYIPDFYSDYRYVLGTAGTNPLITVGINPSTAAPDNLDNTLKSVDRIARNNGFDSFIMFNVYAQRATDPNHMDRLFNEKLHCENMLAFRWVLEHSNSIPTIWAAWGTIIEKRPYLTHCLADMITIANKYFAKWCKAGAVSRKGHPHHPLYLKKDTMLEQFSIDEYIKLLNLAPYGLF